MVLATIKLKEALMALPQPWPVDPLPEIKEEIQKNPVRVFSLDDDPTGSQTVENVSLLTDWSVESLKQEFDNSQEASFLLLNTRSKTEIEAESINRQVGKNLRQASKSCGTKISAVSRSDSTLRGHFPGEVLALADSFMPDYDALLFMAFFWEGGRYTINDIHYVLDGDTLTPVGQTSFARDAAFAYKSSNLKDWMEEKFDRKIRSNEVASISIENIREGGPDRVLDILMSLEEKKICIINAAEMRDVDVFTLACLRAEAKGKQFIYRTTASFIRSRIGQDEHPLLTSKDMVSSGTAGGLIVVGSHVPSSTDQLNELLKLPCVEGINVDVESVLSESPELVASITNRIDDALSSSRDVVIYTSRDVITGSSPEEYLKIGSKITDTLAEIVGNQKIKPRYIISKGGTTSEKLLINAMGVKKAIVPGQILPGVLVLELGQEAKYPGLRMVLFPGNVMGSTSIANIVKDLRNNE